jgi:hypothetical protein
MREWSASLSRSGQGHEIIGVMKRFKRRPISGKEKPSKCFQDASNLAS